MEFKYYAAIARRWAWLGCLCAVIAASISYAATSRLPKVYSATTTLMVGQILQDANPKAADFTTSEQLASTYAQLVRRQPVLQATVDSLQLGLPWQALVGQVNAAALPNTQLVQISVLDNDPRRAVAIADEIARQLISQSPTPRDQAEAQRQQFVAQQLADLQKKIAAAQARMGDLQQRVATESSARSVQDIQGQIATLQQQIASWQSTYAGLLANQGGGTNNLRIVDPASASSNPVSPNIRLNVAAAAGIGVVLAVMVALLLEYLNDTLKSAQDVQRVLGIPTLGAIAPGSHRRRMARRLMMSEDVDWNEVSEAYRVLCTNLRFTTFDTPSNLLLVTSAIPGEGKSTTASNLAVTLAASGRRVILCDADLRRPMLHTIFGLHNRRGLSSLLIDPDLPLDSVVVATDVPGLYVVPSGPVPTNPAELLGSQLMKRRVFEMEEVADMVIFDSPALLAVADAAIIAAMFGSALLIIDSKRTGRDVVLRGAAVLEQVGARLLGVVLTNTRNMTGPYRNYYHASSDKTQVHPGPVQRLASIWTSMRQAFGY